MVSNSVVQPQSGGSETGPLVRPTAPRGWWSPARRKAAVASLGAAAILLAAWLVVPDARGLGTHEKLFLLPCVFHKLTGLPCPFCGMTTAFALMACGQLAPAFAAHVLGPLAYLVTWAVLLAGIGGLVREREPLPRVLFSEPAGRIILALLLAGWAVNLIRMVW